MSDNKQIIANGSKTFSLASLFFSDTQKYAAWSLYSWCRYCDDLIDNEKDLSKQQHHIDYLKKQLSNLDSPELDDKFKELKIVLDQFNIPSQYPKDMIRGMEMDVNSKVIKDESDLKDYCYCVAGTVGLMMCHVMGVKDNIALNHAVSLGEGMQLTNITRDIAEDLNNQRIYIPENWILNLGITRQEILDNPKNINLLKIQTSLLDMADEQYRSGHVGLQYLSLRSAWAVMIAGEIYRAIGTEIKKDQIYYLENRAIVSFFTKIKIIIKCSFKMLPLMLNNNGKKNLSIPTTVWGP